MTINHQGIQDQEYEMSPPQQPQQPQHHDIQEEEHLSQEQQNDQNDEDRAESSQSEENTFTMEEIVDYIGFGKFHWKLLFLCGVGYFAEITELVVVSFVAPSIQRQMGLSNFQYSLLGSSSFVGMAVGAFFWGYVSDHTGRRLSFALTVWLTFLGGFLSSVSPNYGTLLFLRFVAAFGIGGMLPVDYTVFLEFLPERHRGSYIVLVDAIGVVPALTLSASIAWYFAGEVVHWRYVLALSSVPVGIMAILRRHVPESPRYHLAAGETAEARRIVQEVAHANSVVLPNDWRLLSQEEEQEKAIQEEQKFAQRQAPNSRPPLTNRKRVAYAALPTQNSEYEMTQHSSSQSEDPLQAQPMQEQQSLQQQSEQSVDAPLSYHNHPGGDCIVRNERDRCLTTNNGVAAPHAFGHANTVELISDPELRGISYRLWIIFFCVQFSSSGMVFALPKLFDETFPGKSEREIALDLLIGVVGLIPGLAIAFYAVEWSRTRTLAAFSLAAGVSVLGLGYAFMVSKSHAYALCLSIVLRGAMEGCFAVLNTTGVESYPTLLRASGLGTAQIFDHIAGSFSPVIFGYLNASESTRPFVFVLYCLSYLVATIPALRLREYADP